MTSCIFVSQNMSVKMPMRTVGIGLARQLERIRVGQILIGGGDGEDDAVRTGDVRANHVAQLLLNVGRLVACREQ